MRIGFLLIACVILSIVKGDANSDSDSKYIQSRDYEFYLQKTKNDVTKSCAVNEMAAYGLTADVSSLSDPNPICPQMQGNCCGPKDQELINTYWKTDDRYQAGYHIAYLRMNKYILGNIKNYLNIASDIITKSRKLGFQGKNKINTGSDKAAPLEDDGKPYSFEYHPMCEKAAKDFINLDFVNSQKAQGFYEKLNKKAEFMQNSRRGFYCMLCNAKSKEYISTFRALIDSRLWYSRDFCQMIFAQAFSPVYMIYKSYNPFLKALMTMLSCIKPRSAGNSNQQQQTKTQDNNGPQATVKVSFNPVSLSMNLKVKDPIKLLPPDAKKMFENPLNVKKKGWLEICYNSDPSGVFFGLKCMGFCEAFRMTKRSKLFDGDIDAVQTLYEQLLQYEFALNAPDTNIFNDDVPNLRRSIVVEIQYLRNNYNFYRSLSPRINFSKYKTVFSLIWKGINPMALSQGTTLEFKYKWTAVVSAAVSALLALLL